MMSKFIEDKEKKTKSKQTPLKLEKLIYDNNSQDMPIIARKNNKELDISNNDTFIIKKIDIKKQMILIMDDDKEIDFPIDEFQKLFYIAFCITTHKSQGSTFNEPYTVIVGAGGVSDSIGANSSVIGAGLTRIGRGGGQGPAPA